MGLLRKAMAGAAGTMSEGLMDAHRSSLAMSRDEKRFDLEREKAEILAKSQERLAVVRANAQKNSGTSSTLAELNYLNSIEDPQDRASEERKMMNLKRAGYSHGEERFDASGKKIVDVETTASNKANVAGAVEKAELEEQLETKPKISQAEQTAKNAALKAKEAFDEIGEVRTNLRNLDDAITEIDNGAGTGVIEKYLPSVKASTIKLQNIKTKLGLDELAKFKGSTTERELGISLDTALPDKLSEKELRKWLVQKRNRSLEAINVLSKATKFLESGTLGDWLEEREAIISESRSKPIPEQSKGLPAGITEDDITHTMKLHGVTREEVLKRMGGG